MHKTVAFGYEPADLRALFTGLPNTHIPPLSALGKYRICIYKLTKKNSEE